MDDESDNAPRVRLQYSRQGGGQWLDATVSGRTTDLAASPEGTGHTLDWDVQVDDVIGDNVALRLSVEVQAPALAGAPLLRPRVSSVSPTFRVVQCLSGTDACCTRTGTLAAAGSVCRASAGTCDVAETCPGASATCPADAFVADGAVCRASAGTCDAAETCPGASATCPADAFVADGTACDDGSPCTEVDACATGACRGGAPVACDDGDPCTFDSCGEPAGCTHQTSAACTGGGEPDGGTVDDGPPGGGSVRDDGLGCAAPGPGSSSRSPLRGALLVLFMLVVFRRRLQ
jgi:hypothetical protein